MIKNWSLMDKLLIGYKCVGISTARINYYIFYRGAQQRVGITREIDVLSTFYLMRILNLGLSSYINIISLIPNWGITPCLGKIAVSSTSLRSSTITRNWLLGVSCFAGSKLWNINPNVFIDLSTNQILWLLIINLFRILLYLTTHRNKS